MKKKLTVLFLLILTSFALLPGCQKDDRSEDVEDTTGNDSTNNNFKAFLKAKVDGALWLSNQSAKASLSNDNLQLVATQSGGTSITLTIARFPKTTGTYFISGDDLNAAELRLGPNPSDVYSANASIGNGKITVSYYTPGRVKGTFDFMGRNNDSGIRQVTEGEFDMGF